MPRTLESTCDEGALIAIRKVADVVGLRRGLDSLLFDVSAEH